MNTLLVRVKECVKVLQLAKKYSNQIQVTYAVSKRIDRGRVSSYDKGSHIQEHRFRRCLSRFVRSLHSGLWTAGCRYWLSALPILDKSRHGWLPIMVAI